jgi:hypothetical protein
MSTSVPAIAYGFVGLTALVLTYATLADNEGKSDAETPSATSMLPAVGLTEPQSPTLGEIATPPATSVATSVATSESSPMAEAEQEGRATYGGKKRKTKGEKKSKMKKEKQGGNKKKKNTRRNARSKA